MEAKINDLKSDATEQLSKVEAEQLKLFGDTAEERKKYFEKHGQKVLDLIQQVESFPGYMGKPPLIGKAFDNNHKECLIDLEKLLYLNTENSPDSPLSFFVRLSESMSSEMLVIVFSAPIDSVEKSSFQNEGLCTPLNSCQIFSPFAIANKHKDERKFSLQDFSWEKYQNWQKKYVVKKFPIYIKSNNLDPNAEPVFCFKKGPDIYEFYSFFEAIAAALNYVLTPEQISNINCFNYRQISFATEYNRTPYLSHVVKAMTAITRDVLCLDIGGVLGGQLKEHYQSAYPNELNANYVNASYFEPARLNVGSLQVVDLFEELSKKFYICTTSHGGLKSTLDFFKDLMDACERKNKPHLHIDAAVINDPCFKEYTVKNPIMRQEILRTAKGNQFKITIIGFFAESREYKGKQDLFTALSHVILHNSTESHVVDDADSVLNEAQKQGYQTHIVTHTQSFESVLNQIVNKEKQKEVSSKTDLIFHRIDANSHYKIDFNAQFPELYTYAIQNNNYPLANEFLLQICRGAESGSADNANYMFELFWLHKEILPFFIISNEYKIDPNVYYSEFSKKYKNLFNKNRFELIEKFLSNRSDFVFKVFPDYSIIDGGTILPPAYIMLALKTDNKKYLKLPFEPFGIIYIGELLLQQESYLRKDLCSDEERKICKLFKHLAEKGSVFANYYYAEMLNQGIFTTIDKEQALHYVKKATDKKHIKALFLLSKLLEGKVNGREIVCLWQMCANVNYPDALFNLALCYKEGDKDKGIERNPQKAFGYYKKIVDNNKHSRAFFELAKCYEDGIGCSKDPKLAFKYYQEAVNNGYRLALFELAKCYEDGIGCPKDPKLAFKYYQEASDRDMRAFFKVAKCYQAGEGCDKNLKAAFAYYQIAVDNGYEPAFFELAKCYHDGIGCEINKEEALKYFQLAQNHDPKAKQYVAQLITPPSASHYLEDSLPHEQSSKAVVTPYSSVFNSPQQPFGRTQTPPLGSNVIESFQTSFQSPQDNNRAGTPTQIPNHTFPVYSSSPIPYQTNPFIQPPQHYNMPSNLPVYPGSVFHSYSNYPHGGQHPPPQGYHGYPYQQYPQQQVQGGGYPYSNFPQGGQHYPQPHENVAQGNNLQFYGTGVFHQPSPQLPHNNIPDRGVSEYIKDTTSTLQKNNSQF